MSTCDMFAITPMIIPETKIRNISDVNSDIRVPTLLSGGMACAAYKSLKPTALNPKDIQCEIKNENEPE